MSNKELKLEDFTMVNLHIDCAKMIIEDLSMYTSMMASILDVKMTLVGCKAPVQNRNDWNNSLTSDNSSLQLQKWIFAWMYARSNYNTLVINLKSPDESFEDRFMEKHILKYNEECLKKMKKIQNVQFSFSIMFATEVGENKC